MRDRAETLEQIRLVGLEVLARELGPVGMVRFLQQFETGSGDYSTERHQLLDHLRVEDIFRCVRLRGEEQ